MKTTTKERTLPETYTGLLGAPMSPLTRDQSELLVSGIMMSAEQHATLCDNMEQVVAQYMIVKSRLEQSGWLPYISKGVLAFVPVLCDRPGICVLWAYTLAVCAAKKAKHAKGEAYTLDDWCEDFPMGIPTNEQIRPIWDAQKVKQQFPKSDNGIDDFNNWPKP